MSHRCASLAAFGSPAWTGSAFRKGIHARAQCPARRTGKLRCFSVRSDGRFVDPDEQRRIEENKRWRRSDPAEDVWDIDKERAATTYKREALESIFQMTAADRPDPLAPRSGDTYVCAACGHVIATSSDALEMGGAHRHTATASDGAELQIGTFSSAQGMSETGVAQVPPPAWAASDRPCLGGVCGGCGAHLGWSYRAQSGDDESFKAVQMDTVRTQDPKEQ